MVERLPAMHKTLGLIPNPANTTVATTLTHLCSLVDKMYHLLSELLVKVGLEESAPKSLHGLYHTCIFLSAIAMRLKKLVFSSLLPC